MVIHLKNLFLYYFHGRRVKTGWIDTCYCLRTAEWLRGEVKQKDETAAVKPCLRKWFIPVEPSRDIYEEIKIGLHVQWYRIFFYHPEPNLKTPGGSFSASLSVLSPVLSPVFTSQVRSIWSTLKVKKMNKYFKFGDRGKHWLIVIYQ